MRRKGEAGPRSQRGGRGTCRVAPASGPDLLGGCGSRPSGYRGGSRSSPGTFGPRGGGVRGGCAEAREAGAQRRGSEAGAGAGRGRGHPPRPTQDPPPCLPAPCPSSRAAAEPGLGAGEAGGIPEGIPPPPPAAPRPRTHVSAGPAGIPPAAQRVPASRRCLRCPVPAPARRHPWRVPAAPARRFAGLRHLHPGAARRPRHGQAAPASPGAGEWGHRGSARPGALGSRRAGSEAGLAHPGVRRVGRPCVRVPSSRPPLSLLPLSMIAATHQVALVSFLPP